MIFGIITLILAVQTQLINKEMRNQKIQNWLLVDQIVLCTLLILFYIAIGLKTSLILTQTGVSMKWPLFLTIWLICITYVLDGVFQFLIYVDQTFVQHQFDHFDVFEARTVASTCHNVVIYLALWLLIYHTQRINTKTIRLLFMLELKRAEDVRLN